MNKDMNNLRKTVRPKAHASPRENAMYRSFGSLYSRGKYHIFFEHFPFGLYSSHRFVLGTHSGLWVAGLCQIFPAYLCSLFKERPVFLICPQSKQFIKMW